MIIMPPSGHVIKPVSVLCTLQ